MSVQSNSGSGGGSLEATPSWSQLSSSPTISQQHITATAKSKEGTVARQVRDRLLSFSLRVLCGWGGLLWPFWADVSWSKNWCKVHWCRELEAKRQLSEQLTASLSSSELSWLHKGCASLLFVLCHCQRTWFLVTRSCCWSCSLAAVSKHVPLAAAPSWILT